MRLFPRAGNYMVSLKDQLWIHDYDWETRNPITPVVVKVKVRRQLSCRFFQLRSFLDKEEEVGGRPCASNFEVPGWKLNSKILYIFFLIFLKMYLVKWICLNVFVQMYFSKCICKMYLSNCICQNVFFSCLSISLIKCLKGQKCLGLLFNVKNQKWLSEWVSEWVTQWLSQWQNGPLILSKRIWPKNTEA